MAMNSVDTNSESLDEVLGVVRVFKNGCEGHLWYWQASWLEEMVLFKELYSEARFGPNEARRLAIEAKRVEEYYSRLLRRKAPITKQERKKLRAERLEMKLARKKLLNYKVTADGQRLVKGVDYDPSRERFVVRWVERRRRMKKSFSVRQLGFDSARQLAIDFRMVKDDCRMRRFVFPD